MNYSQVYDQITALPPPYLREGPNFDSLMSALSYAFVRYTDSADFTFNSNLSLSTMDHLWLNLIGLMVNVPRNNNTTIDQYRTQIQSAVAEPQGTPVAMLKFLSSLGIEATYADNFSGPGDYSTYGYKISLTTPNSNYNQLALALNRVRPAGVPFNPLYVLSGGIYVTSVSYLGDWQLTGSYIFEPYSALYFTIPSTTNNNSATIPTSFLTNPVINPSLA